jgi:hypothetical protein
LRGTPIKHIKPARKSGNDEKRDGERENARYLLQSPVARPKLEITQHGGAAHEVESVEHVCPAVFGNYKSILHEFRE